MEGSFAAGRSREGVNSQPWQEMRLEKNRPAPWALLGSLNSRATVIPYGIVMLAESACSAASISRNDGACQRIKRRPSPDTNLVTSVEKFRT